MQGPSPQADRHDATDAPGSPLAPPMKKQLTLAVSNPGRSGFLHLGSELLMEWRLEAVAHALDQDGVDICVLPGARLPPEAILPPAFPYLVEGSRSRGLDSVAIFFRPELRVGAPAACRFLPTT